MTEGPRLSRPDAEVGEPGPSILAEAEGEEAVCRIMLDVEFVSNI
jgi:hypothetical protein